MTGPTPPEAPLAMPAQDLRRRPPILLAPQGTRLAAQGWRVRCARLIAFGGAAALTVAGAYEMFMAFGPGAVTLLQWALLALFTVTFGWIALSSTSALAGLLAAPRRASDGGQGPLASLTAIIMPVFSEDAARTAGALAAMGSGLADLGHGRAFELFMLSDTRDADAVARETTAMQALRRLLGGRMAAWWRRRGAGGGGKAGNVAEFVRRWGGRYDHMLVLDADSLMAPATIVRMVRRMEADPALGLLQSNPTALGADTAFARLQQFAAAVYGPVVARGVAAWQGLDGNFWGHNALIRVSAFAAAAGLPDLPGRKPFGGHILSHDFVEAALLRRAGWGVRMDPDLTGSWEGAPPSLLAASRRDRRWAQGNLQHGGVIGAAGLRWPSRTHMAIGIGSYLMSPIWLTMLVVGVALTIQASLVQPDYFPQLHQLFPVWPWFDRDRMTALLAVAAGLLLFPKALGLAEALADRARRRALGGGAAIMASGAVELAASTLLAPAQMLMQCRHVAEIVLGRDAGWSPQARDGAALPWSQAWRAHGGHATLGAGIAAALAATQPQVLVWLSPVLAGLMLAPWLSRLSGQTRAGSALRAAGLLRTVEEIAAPPLAQAADAASAQIAAASAQGLADLIDDAWLAAGHTAMLGDRADAPGVRLPSITAAAKIAAADGPAQALEWLDAHERLALVDEAALLAAWRGGGKAPVIALAASR